MLLQKPSFSSQLGERDGRQGETGLVFFEPRYDLWRGTRPGQLGQYVWCTAGSQLDR